MQLIQESDSDVAGTLDANFSGSSQVEELQMHPSKATVHLCDPVSHSVPEFFRCCNVSEIFKLRIRKYVVVSLFLASQDAIEVMSETDSLTEWTLALT